MARLKKKPDLSPESIGPNPLAETLEIQVTRKYHKVLNKYDEKDEVEYSLDKTPFTKVYEVKQGKVNMIDLPLRSKELYLYVLYSLESGQDIIWIDRMVYMDRMKIRSVNTFKEAVWGLSLPKYIYPHAKLKDVYWINPHYFFKGNRINKYPNNIKY
jgi:hypothetical protein